MSTTNIIQMFDWKRQKDLDSPLGELIKRHHASLLKRTMVPRETICVCWLRDLDGDSACLYCPENPTLPDGVA